MSLIEIPREDLGRLLTLSQLRHSVSLLVSVARAVSSNLALPGIELAIVK